MGPCLEQSDSTYDTCKHQVRLTEFRGARELEDALVHHLTNVHPLNHECLRVALTTSWISASSIKMFQG